MSLVAVSDDIEQGREELRAGEGGVGEGGSAQSESAGDEVQFEFFCDENGSQKEVLVQT